MKSLIFLLFVLLTFDIVSNGQQAWIKQSPPIYPNAFCDVHMLSENKAIAVGKSGTILMTNDSGINWTEIASGTDEDLNSICFINSDTGWIVGGYPTILKTSDGGSTWNQISSNLSNYIYLKDVYFSNSNIGWVLSKGNIYKTIDGGMNWSIQFTAPSLTFLESFYFFDENKGIAVGSSGSGKVYLTTNGGNNWIENSLFGASWIYDVYFSDELNGWAVGLRASQITISSDMWGGISIDIVNPFVTMWHTTDGGTNWSQRDFLYSGRLYGVYFSDSDIGWAAGEQGIVLKTEDGGSSWNFTKNIHDLNAIHFFNLSSGISVGETGTLQISSDGGDTWKLISGSGTFNHLLSVQFLNQNVGLAVGAKGTILNTLDGGNTWSDYYIQYNNKNTTWTSVCFLDSQNGYILGQGFNNIVGTYNSGALWSWNERKSNWYINDAFFINPSTGWLVGNHGIIGHRNGKSGFDAWISQTSGTTNNLHSVFFVDSLTGWAGGENFTLLFTQNGGNTWTSQKDKLPNELSGYGSINSIFFVDDQKGYAVGSFGTILNTIDGGDSWNLLYDYDISLYDVYFIDNNTGWAVGNDGTILKTENGGNQWGVQNCETTEDLQSMHFLNDKTGWIVGYNGTILKTNTGGGNIIYPPPIPELIWPENGSINVPVDPTLNWNVSEGAISYQLLVSEYSDFHITDVYFTDLTGTTYSLSNLENEKTYYWKMKANNDVIASNWSPVWNFTTTNITGSNQQDVIHFTIYPVPANDILYIEGIENEYAIVSVLSIDGILLKQIIDKGITAIDISDIAEGTFILKVTSSRICSVKKIVKF
jgi:photosystem II stability/assembly factor-like uncharacterized protein